MMMLFLYRCIYIDDDVSLSITMRSSQKCQYWSLPGASCCSRIRHSAANEAESSSHRAHVINSGIRDKKLGWQQASALRVIRDARRASSHWAVRYACLQAEEFVINYAMSVYRLQFITYGVILTCAGGSPRFGWFLSAMFKYEQSA